MTLIGLALKILVKTVVLVSGAPDDDAENKTSEFPSASLILKINYSIPITTS